MQKPLSEQLEAIREQIGGHLFTIEGKIIREAIEKLRAYENLSAEVSEIVQAELEDRDIKTDSFRSFYKPDNIKVVLFKFKM